MQRKAKKKKELMAMILPKIPKIQLWKSKLKEE